MNSPLTHYSLGPLWAAMLGIYGSRWESSYGADPRVGAAGPLWARGLAGLTDDQIRRGVDACIASADDWPPTLPAFRRLCLEIPPQAAVVAAVLGGRTNPTGPTTTAPFLRFVAGVWSRLDAYRLRQAPIERAERMVADAYTLTRDAVLAGHPLPEIPAAALSAPEPVERKPADPERARAAMAAVAAALGARIDPEVT